MRVRQAATVSVYDVAGRLVRTIVRDVLPAGDHTTTWNGRDAAGHRVAGGTYLTLDAGETVAGTMVFLGD